MGVRDKSSWLILLFFFVFTGELLYLFFNRNFLVRIWKKDVKPVVSEIMPTVQPIPLLIRGSVPYWDQERASKSFKENAEVFDHIALFWYYLNDEGDISKYKYAKEDKTLISFAHQRGIKVAAVITNLPEYEGADWDSDLVEQMLDSKERRAAHIEEIYRLLEAMDFDSVSIDYEEVAESQKDAFSTFIAELASYLHPRGKYVGVALHPKTGERIPRENNGSWSQDWRQIAKYADYLYFMTYGEHWEESNSGPIASYNWVKRVIDYAISLRLPREKIFMGIPLYGYAWKQESDDKAKGLTYEDIKALIKKHDIKEQWDAKARSGYFTYGDDKTSYRVWYENARSVSEKIQLAKELGLGGVTFWRLGGEDPKIWE